MSSYILCYSLKIGRLDIMYRLFFIIGALFAGLAVAIGAATGHVANNPFSEIEQLWLAKGVRYQFNHGLALVLVAMALYVFNQPRSLLALAGWCFIAGTLCFSGSLYLMTFAGLSTGYLTPIGGFGYLAGWLCLLIAGFSLKN